MFDPSMGRVREADGTDMYAPHPPSMTSCVAVFVRNGLIALDQIYGSCQNVRIIGMTLQELLSMSIVPYTGIELTLKTVIDQVSKQTEAQMMAISLCHAVAKCLQHARTSWAWG
jgi:hypothetical protein